MTYIIYQMTHGDVGDSLVRDIYLFTKICWNIVNFCVHYCDLHVSCKTFCLNRSLQPTNEVWGKVMFLHLSVILFTRSVCPIAC